MRNLRKRIWLIGIALLLVSAVPVNLMAMRQWPVDSHGHDVSLKDILEGHVTARLAERYNRNFPLRQFAIDLFGTLSFVLFGEGRADVVVGKDGWLYTAEEFRSTAESTERIGSSVSEIIATARKLERTGIQLAVLLVPAKARLYPEKLGSIKWPQEPSERYERVLIELRREGITVADPLREMLLAKADGDIFLKTDTHWTPLGAAAAARAVARAAAFQQLGEAEQFSPVAISPVEYKGDLMRYIPVLPMLASLTPANERIPQVDAQKLAGDSAQSLFGKEDIAVALVGTSYSANITFGFEAQLKMALSHDVLNLAEQGGGPFAPMRKFIAGLAQRDSKPKLAIWEIPERYLDDPDGESAQRRAE